LAIGLYHQMSLDQAARTFTLLTIGDGLVTQLPALLISISAGLLVSRGSQECNLPRESIGQLFNRSVVLWLTAGFLAILATTNLPTIPLLCLSAAAALSAVMAGKRERQSATLTSHPVPNAAPPREATVEKLLAGDVLELQLGASLIPLADAQQRGTLLAEVTGVRQRLATELGIVLPKVRIRDNLRLPTRVFQFLLFGETVLRGEAHPDRVMAQGPLPSQPARIPCDLPWAPRGNWVQEAEAESLPAIQLLTATQVITESLLWVARKHAADLLSRDATAELLEEVRKHHPAAARELSEQSVPLSRTQRILGRLVREGISIRHLGRIVEMIADAAATQSDEVLVEHIRIALRRQTSQRLRNDLGVIRAMGVSEDVVAMLGISPSEADKARTQHTERLELFRRSIDAGIRHMQQAGMLPILVVPSLIRPVVSGELDSFLGTLFVIGDGEIDSETALQIIARITANDLEPSAGQAA
ncbi:MAG TPA: FHIPEP family type III secretion protein, partial [Pirellulaceae bacterium]|nr:FHIPEP family type III secretion protein [Pirellulaceae bacterium]